MKKIVLLLIVILSFGHVFGQETKTMLNEIIPIVKEKDGSLTHTLGYTNIKSFKFGEDEFIVAEDSSFAIISANEGGRMFYDKGCDGTIDKLLINSEKGVSEKAVIRNALYIFQSMSSLMEDAQITANLLPKEIKVLSVNNDEVQAVDLSDGVSVTFTGEDAEDMIKKMQSYYKERLAGIVNKL